MPHAARVALESILESAERVDLMAPAVGCTLFLTDRRLVLVREGASHRPKTGVRSWLLDRDLVLRVGVAYHATNRLVIVRAKRSASVFVTAAQLGDVKLLIAEI